MIEHLHTGDPSRTHAALTHGVHGVAEESDQVPIDDASSNAATRRAYEARSVELALEARGPPEIGDLIGCPENTWQALRGQSGTSGTHYPQEFTSIQAHLDDLALPMTRIAVKRFLMFTMAVHAEVHVDLDQGTLRRALGVGDRSVTVRALQFADAYVSAMRVENVRR